MPPLIQLLLVIAVLGMIAYFVEAFIPMSEPFKMLFRAVIVIIVIYLLLGLIGVVEPIRLR